MEALTKVGVRLRGRFVFENTDVENPLGAFRPPRRSMCRWKARSKRKTCGLVCLFLLFLLGSFQLYYHFISTSGFAHTLYDSWERVVLHAHANGHYDHNATGQCMNSAQGHTFVTDSEGTICLRRNVQANGCCGLPTARLSCEGCALGCCQIFEYCLSCCLRTTQQIEERELTPGDFTKCLHSCRTSSRSLRRGNLYKFSRFPYCFEFNVTSRFNTLLLAGLAPLLDGHPTSAVISLQKSTTAISKSNQNCRDACANLLPLGKWVCHEGYFPFVNNCSVLRHHFTCDRCAGEGHPVGSDQPSFYVPDAPDDLQGLMQYHLEPEPWWSPRIMQFQQKASELGSLNPNTCVVNVVEESFDCEAFHPFAQRLCPCVELAGATFGLES